MNVYFHEESNKCIHAMCPNRFITRLYPKWPPACPLCPFAHNPTYSEGRPPYCATNSNIITPPHPFKTQSNLSGLSHKTFCSLCCLWKFIRRNKDKGMMSVTWCKEGLDNFLSAFSICGQQGRIFPKSGYICAFLYICYFLRKCG